MEITAQSKLIDVLDAYPFLEAQIVQIAPPFRNLTNPVLRRTVGKLATIEKVAQVGGMDPARLVNTLRKAAGQAELAPKPEKAFAIDIARSSGDPEWTAGEPEVTIDGSALLERGEVPLGKVNESLARLAPGRCLLLVTDFEPTPILDALEKQNRRVYHKVDAEGGLHLTFIG